MKNTTENFSSLLTTPYEKMIVACLPVRRAANLDEIAQYYRQCQEQRLFRFAQEHEVAGIVAERLRAIGQITPIWENEAKAWKYRLTQRFEALDALASALSDANIPLVALKNAGIARAIYPYPEECPMGDFDVLVRKSDFSLAHDIVMSQGFELDFRAEETIEEAGVQAGLLSGGTEYKKDLGDDILWLELQWRAIAGRWIAPEVEPNADELIEKSIPVEGSALRILDPVSNLLQVCLHTAKHSYVRAPGLRLHTDVDRIVRAYPDLDWDSFVARVKAMHVKTSVYFSLKIPSDLFHTPVPEHVLIALEPPKCQKTFLYHAIRRAGLFHPLHRKFRRPEYLAFCALLFDHPAACMHSAFPSPEYMRAHYGVSSRQLLPCYAKRFFNLIFKRVKT